MRCSGRRKKSSICSTLPPNRSLRIWANVVLPDAHGPSMATNTRSRVSSPSSVAKRAIALSAVRGDASFMSTPISVEHCQTVRARTDAEFFGVFERVLAVAGSDAFGDGRAVGGDMDEIHACLIERHRVKR